MHSSIVRITALTVLTSLFTVSAGASEESLAAAQPEHLIFFSMTSNGLRAFAGLEQRLPASLDEALELGYFPYQLSQSSGVQYFQNGSTARLSTGGAIVAGRARGVGMVIDLSVPTGPPSTSANRMLPDALTGSLREQQVEFETFPGGVWVSQGHNTGQVRDALRLQRLRTHLTWVALSWQEGSSSAPSSLAQLEQHQGLERTEAAWRDVSVVNTPQEVDNTPLSIFAGNVPQHLKADVGPVFLVKVNTGLGVQESGTYRDAAGVVRFFGDVSY